MNRLALLGCLLFAPACGGDSGPTPIEVEGAWSGSVTTGQTTGVLTFTATETAGNVTGTGALTSPGFASSLSLQGTYTAPNLSLTLTAPGFEPLNLTATVGESSMSGTLNGSGFTGSAVTLERQ